MTGVTMGLNKITSSRRFQTRSWESKRT